MVEQSCDNIPNFAEITDLEEVSHIIEGRDLETLIVVLIETLTRNSKNCSKEDVLHLVQESVDNGGCNRALRRASKQIMKMLFCANKTRWNTDLFVFTERGSVFKESQAIQ